MSSRVAPRPARFLPAFALAAGLIACAPPNAPAAETPPATAAEAPAETRVAVFAAGCFWCMEKPFDEAPGVLETVSGFTGGTVAAPTYEQVTAGGTGHTEAVRVTYDPARITYARLLEIYWRQVDPFDPDGQFCDQGDSYRPGIFVATPEERAAAEASKAAVQRRLSAPIVVPIEAAGAFYPAEAYHQDYYKKNPVRYSFYRNGCGRDARLKQVWGD